VWPQGAWYFDILRCCCTDSHFDAARDLFVANVALVVALVVDLKGPLRVELLLPSRLPLKGVRNMLHVDGCAKDCPR